MKKSNIRVHKIVCIRKQINVVSSSSVFSLSNPVITVVDNSLSVIVQLEGAHAIIVFFFDNRVIDFERYDDEGDSRKKEEVERRGRAGDKPLFGRNRTEENEAGADTLLRLLRRGDRPVPERPPSRKNVPAETE